MSRGGWFLDAGRQVARCCAWILVLSAVATGLFGGSFWSACVALAAASVSGCAAGLLGGALAGRREVVRSLRIRRQEAAFRGARYGTMAAYTGLWYGGRNQSSLFDALILGLGFGAFMALFGTLWGSFLSEAERSFARAHRCLRKGDTQGARRALREYLEHAEKDPLREARVPAAERFIAGETDTLVVSTELLAAEAPAGRGTELAAAERPEGSGTEVMAADEPVMDTTGDQARRAAAREPAGGTRPLS